MTTWVILWPTLNRVHHLRHTSELEGQLRLMVVASDEPK